MTKEKKTQNYTVHLCTLNIKKLNVNDLWRISEIVLLEIKLRKLRP